MLLRPCVSYEENETAPGLIFPSTSCYVFNQESVTMTNQNFGASHF
jgi:hypothetical protein